jgi:hypothetical protein
MQSLSYYNTDKDMVRMKKKLLYSDSSLLNFHKPKTKQIP